MKTILYTDTYTFDPSAKTITVSDDIKLEEYAIITNVTTNDIIYNFACDGFGGAVSGKTLTLEYDTTAMSSTDVLHILVYSDLTPGEKINLSYINEIRKNTKVLNDIAELLTIQNKLIEQMF